MAGSGWVGVPVILWETEISEGPVTVVSWEEENECFLSAYSEVCILHAFRVLFHLTLLTTLCQSAL